MLEINNELVKRSIISGIISVIIGYTTEKILYVNDCHDNFLTKMKQKCILRFILSLFLFGCCVHIFSELIGFEAYCERKCNEAGKCSYSCRVGFKA